MNRFRLLLRNLAFYRRTNFPIVAGVAIAVAVLSGALLVGQSVRVSLRRLLYERIGAAEYLVTAEHFFGEDLAAKMNPAIDSCPIIYLKGTVIREQTGVRSHEVNVYGVDDRFWKFHGLSVPEFSNERAAYVGDPLARQLSLQQDDSLLLRVEMPQSIPKEWLYGRRDNGGRTLRLICSRVLPGAELGEFSLRPSQGNVYSIFVPMKRLQKDLAQQAKINAIVLARPAIGNGLESISNLLRQSCRLDDFGIRTVTSGRGFSLESSRIILDDAIAEAAIQTAASIGVDASPIYSYLANSIRSGAHEIPYSVITAADIGAGALRSVKVSGAQVPAGSPDSIWLTEWAQRDLVVSAGAPVEIDYYLWRQEGKLETRTARFRLAGILPDSADINESLAPQIPGVTDSRSISSWDPPFPLQMERIRPKDEDYWQQHKATPKAFVSLAKGQELWGSRFGKLTGLRISVPEAKDVGAAQRQFSQALLRQLHPLSAGFSLNAIREQGLAASQGSTDFGEYFVYFSFFLIAAAILLAALFFRLLIEQRVREIGILQACGFSTGFLQRNFLYEGAILSAAGSILGLAGSLVYGWLMIFGLRTWWTDAVGTQRIFLHVSWSEMLIGCLCGSVVSLAYIAWTLRTLRHNSTRMLLAGALESVSIKKHRVRMLAITSLSSLLAAAALLAASVRGSVSQILGFFGAGFLLLLAILCGSALYLRRKRHTPIKGRGFPAFFKIGLRNATHRAGRSLLCASLIAAATFIVVSMEAFRQDSQGETLERNSGTGGFSLLADSTIPILYDLNSDEGRDAIGLSPEQLEAFQKVHFVPFRKRPGDDVSCLNLYTPQTPEILGARRAFSEAGRFAFQGALAAAPEQEKNPWLLLEAFPRAPFIPAIADATTLQYILHLSLGSELVIKGERNEPVRLRFIAALKNSVLQGKLVISESNFQRAFPSQEGYRFFLLDAPQKAADALTPLLQEGLADYGFSVESSKERLASYHRVENTYLSTFQSLGTLGLFLGTLGLASVLLRNVLERRHELALLRAIGYRNTVISIIILAENALLIVWGLLAGLVCALIAILPAIHARGVAIPFGRMGLIALAVLAAGLIASLAAVIAAQRAPLLPALRSE